MILIYYPLHVLNALWSVSIRETYVITILIIKYLQTTYTLRDERGHNIHM